MRFHSSIVAGLVACTTAALISSASIAQTEKVIYSFPGGSYPFARLEQDRRGNLYGTTSSGGLHGYGSVFELVKKGGVWKERDLYSFFGDEAAFPYEGVIDVNGTLWGTTEEGGSIGYGTVFSLTPAGGTWLETVVHSFAGSDGADPIGYLYRDRITGDIYGTTHSGGSSNCGTVFSINPRGTAKTVYAFKGGDDGCGPSSTLRKGPRKGTLIGTTEQGGAQNKGAVYLLTQNGKSWSESVIYTFTGGLDGATPSDIDLDNTGNVFGTAFWGGIGNNGVVFELTFNRHEWHQSVLYTFKGQNVDGQFPLSMRFDGRHNTIYGTTEYGGTDGSGTVFKLVPNGSQWTESVLYSFNFADGDQPYSRPVVDRITGQLYGTTISGGQFGGGEVYEITP